MAFKIKRFIPASPLRNEEAPRFKVNLGKNIPDETADEKATRDFTANLKNQKPKPKTKTKTVSRKKVSAIKTPKAKEIKSTIKASKASDVDVSKKPTVKTAPKDNSRKAIRKRKKADKAAGVSKSQMRANKAKSKAEAALEKAKKSKNPSYRAQLKRKSDRLAKRAERKGGSPAKAIGDPKDPKKKYGKVTVKKEKKGNTTTVTATRPYSTGTSKGKDLGPDFKPTKAQTERANKRREGKETKSITVVDKKSRSIKSTASKPAADLSKKPTLKKLTKKEKIASSKIRKQDAFDKAHNSTAEQRKKSHNPQKKKKNLFKVKSNLRKRVSRGSNFKQSCK